MSETVARQREPPLLQTLSGTGKHDIYRRLLLILKKTATFFVCQCRDPFQSEMF
jgi:hypothetical protein